MTRITTDVAIVGGGVIGAACACRLQSPRMQVTILDPGPVPGAASPASAGLLAAQIEPGNTDWIALAVRAREHYIALAADLLHTTGTDIGLCRTGIATFAFSPERARALAAERDRQERAGVRAEWLEATDVERRWPGIAPGCTGALFAPDDGSVSAPDLTRALHVDASRRGVQTIREAVTGIVMRDGRIRGVATGHTTVHSGHVVIAAGAWSPLIARLPRPLPVTPVRGQLLAAPWPAGVATPALYDDHAYVLRRGSDAIMGSTMERVGFDPGVTPSAREAILASARRLLPALGNVDRQWAGLRPVTPDGLPIIGPDPDIEGLWYATGHGRNGMLLAALTGEVIGDLVTTGTTTLDLAPLSISRFGAAVRAATHHAPPTAPLA